MTVLSTPFANEAYAWGSEENPLTPFYKRDQMERAKYMEWILANVKHQVGAGLMDERTTKETGNPNYNLSDLVKVAGQYTNIKTAKAAISHLKDSEVESDFSQLVEGTQAESWKRQHRFEIGPFLTYIFPRLRPGQNGYLPSLARECHIVLGTAVTTGCQKVEKISLNNRERRESLSTDLKNTMTLMETEITKDIQDEVWTKNFEAAADTLEGFVYMITSPLLNAVKIGHWGGNLDSLRSRYVTPYGPALTIHATWLEDRRQAEKDLHLRFAEYRIVNELFRKDQMSYYIENWI